MTELHRLETPLRLDLIGQDSLHGSAVPGANHETDDIRRDIRLRAALRSPAREAAALLLWEVESLLCCGPAGGGGYRGSITPSVITESAYLDRDLVQPAMRIIET
jgi:hypothetical protein